MSIVQALCEDGGFESTWEVSFTSDWQEHEDSGTNGSNPTSGNDLLIVVYDGSANITGVVTTAGDQVTIDTATQLFDGGQSQFWHVSGVSSGVTHIYFTGTANGIPRFGIIEEDTALTHDSAQDHTWAITDSSSGTEHYNNYDTAEDDSIVFAHVGVGSDNDYDSVHGSICVAPDTTSNRCMVYKEVATAGTGQIDWDTAASATQLVAQIVVERAAAAGGVPNYPFGKALYGPFAGPI